MKTVYFATAIALATMLCASTAVGQGVKERYNNPFIDDGVMRETPFQWTTYDVLESRVEYDEYGKPWLHHFVSKDENRVVEELKQAYRKQTPIGPNIYVRGFVYLVQAKHWGFTLAHEGTNVQYQLHVLPHPEGRGADLALLARQRRVQNAAWKRSWFGYSPVGLEPYSAKVKAY